LLGELVMLFLKKPVEEKINSILLSQKKKALSYPHVKGTLEHSSSESFRNDERFSRNYFIDHYRVKIGRGNDIFRKAIDGLRSWKQFSLDWVDLFYPDTPLQGELSLVRELLCLLFVFLL